MGGERPGSSRSGNRGKKLSKAAILQKIKRRAGVWAILFVISVCMYNALVFTGLSRYLSFAGRSQPHLERSALTKFVQEALTGVALPLVPRHDLFDHAAVIVGPYGELQA